MLETNKIYCADNVEFTRNNVPDGFIDLTVTSPPYDNLRTYNGYSWDFEATANELYRVTKTGGVVVWVVNDATVKGSETLTSFSHALFFKNLGFNVETMIWEKTGSGALGSQWYYGQNFEYMFVLSKGKPKSINLICDRENVVKHGKVKVNSGLKADKSSDSRVIERKPFGKRNNIWRITPQKDNGHPAMFPEKLANDHIISWSNEGDLVFDPFCGSGTTCKMAVVNNRRFLGIDISNNYCEIARQRISAAAQGNLLPD